MERANSRTKPFVLREASGGDISIRLRLITSTDHCSRSTAVKMSKLAQIGDRRNVIEKPEHAGLILILSYNGMFWNYRPK